MPDTPTTPTDNPASRYYALVDSGELQEVLRLFSPQIVYDRPGHGQIRGASALRQFFLHERRLAHSRHTIRQYIADGEWIVAEGEVEARTDDGEDLSLSFVDVFRISDDLIIERRGYLAH